MTTMARSGDASGQDVSAHRVSAVTIHGLRDKNRSIAAAPRPPRTDLGVPVAFGYLRVPPSLPRVVGAERVRTLAAVAHRCGWVLGETFVDDEPDRPLLAYRHLRAATLAAVRDHSAPVAVLVVSETEFADAGQEADALRADPERVTGIPVVVTSALRLPDDDPQLQDHPPGWDELITAEGPRTGESGPGGVDPSPRRAR